MVISDHYLSHFTYKVGVGSTRITRLIQGKSYLVIICPNSHKTLTESKLGQVFKKSVRTLLRITHVAHRKSYLVTICPSRFSNAILKQKETSFCHNRDWCPMPEIRCWSCWCTWTKQKQVKWRSRSKHNRRCTSTSFGHCNT